jgi:hypothetical protein
MATNYFENIKPMGTGLSEVKPMNNSADLSTIKPMGTTTYTAPKTYVQSPTNLYTSVPYTSSVVTSDLAKQNVTDNTSKLETANQNLNQPYSSNPAYTTMASLADKTISETGASGITANSEALSKVLLELVGRANSQKETGDYQGMNETLKQYEETKTARDKELADIYAKLPELRQTYQSTLTKTAAEQDLENQLADIQGQINQYGIDTQSAVYGLEGQGRGLTTGLVSGQQEKLQRQRALGEQTLQGRESNLLTRLGLEQENRKLATSAAEYGITSLFEDAEITQKAIDAIDAQTNAFMDQVDKLSDNARNTLSTIIDKFAGMDMADLPEESQMALANLAENAGIDLNTLILGMKANKDAIDFDKNYKLDQLQQKETPSTPTSYNEWQLAGGLEGTGKTYAQFIAGKTSGTVNLSAAQKEDIATMDTVSNMASDVLTQGEEIGWAGTGGLAMGSISQFFTKNLGYGTEEEQNLRNLIGNITGTVAKLRGGTSFTPNEQKLLETYTPTINDSPVMLKSKLKTLIDFINNKKQNTLSVAGGDYSGNSNTTDIKSQVINMGYDYDAMIADGLSDEEIKDKLGL